MTNQGDVPAPTANVRRLASAKSMAPGLRMHPNTPNVRMVDNFGGYTAAAGHAFMVSDALPARLQGKALVTEPTAKLIGIMDIQPDGGGYKSSDGGQSPRQHGRMDVADLRRCRPGRSRLGDRLL